MHQLIYDVLVEPAGHLNLPTSLVEQNTYETHQMRVYGQEHPEVGHCRRVAKLWFRWMETKGVEYPRGIEGTWMSLWELVTVMPRIEEANTNYIAQLLAPPPPPPLSAILCLRSQLLLLLLVPKAPAPSLFPFAMRMRNKYMLY